MGTNGTTLRLLVSLHKPPERAPQHLLQLGLLSQVHLAAPRDQERMALLQRGLQGQNLLLVAPVARVAIQVTMETMEMMAMMALRAIPMRARKRRRKNEGKKTLQRSLLPR